MLDIRFLMSLLFCVIMETLRVVSNVIMLVLVSRKQRINLFAIVENAYYFKFDNIFNIIVMD